MVIKLEGEGGKALVAGPLKKEFVCDFPYLLSRELIMLSLSSRVSNFSKRNIP